MVLQSSRLSRTQWKKSLLSLLALPPEWFLPAPGAQAGAEAVASQRSPMTRPGTSEVQHEVRLRGWASSCYEEAGCCARCIPVPSAAWSKTKTYQGKPGVAIWSCFRYQPRGGWGEALTPQCSRAPSLLLRHAAHGSKDTGQPAVRRTPLRQLPASNATQVPPECGCAIQTFFPRMFYLIFCPHLPGMIWLKYNGIHFN